jgi:hypothetical protein
MLFSLLLLLCFEQFVIVTSSSCSPPYANGLPINREIPTGAHDVIPFAMSRFLFFSSTLDVTVFAPTKVMHSTISYLFKKKCQENCKQDPRLDIKDCKQDPRRDIKGQSKKLINSTRVMLMRDPFDRALSAYINSESTKWIRVGNSSCTSKTCSFTEWLRLLKTHGIDCNEHFWGQAKSASFAHMNYDYVIRYGVPSDMNCLFELLNATQHNHINTNPSANNAHTEQQKLYYFTPEAVSILTELYYLDISVWRMAMRYLPQQDLYHTLAFYLLS